jgi:hypothetical protein
MKINYLHICENVLVTQGSGNLSIINIFENINTLTFPGKHPTMSLVVGFEGKQGEHKVEAIFSDEKEEILKLDSNLHIGQNGRVNWVYKIIDYQIRREMTQKIQIKYQGEVIYETYLTINNK